MRRKRGEEGAMGEIEYFHICLDIGIVEGVV